MESAVSLSDRLRKCPRCPGPLPLDDRHFYRRRDGTRGGFYGYCKPHHLELKRESRRRSALACLDGEPDMVAVLRVVAFGRDPLEDVRRICATTLREVQAYARRA